MYTFQPNSGSKAREGQCSSTKIAGKKDRILFYSTVFAPFRSQMDWIR
jgi:hypothetical protein